MECKLQVYTYTIVYDYEIHSISNKEHGIQVIKYLKNIEIIKK